ncbi:conserved hypothetical protein [Xanthomonas oryzae pv. oryzae KACC 10331]|uniref:CsbD family protein n=1 Tax=Xanthomonas oryzae pv. oryzae (strain KACC10331 / KXO85) TaxID=291331 RepID=Q5GTV2_XANOR|nr:conserved hypothetical protein [Xanthomonas oryzae pv. oryzae KACC 10331]BAE71110.1 conserved hypothetical protein [Xanthomonas oryzae pv. oryzae MAFF 311018]
MVCPKLHKLWCSPHVSLATRAPNWKALLKKNVGKVQRKAGEVADNVRDAVKSTK